MDKKTWQKPELISLERSKPQEAVLDVCKGGIPGDPLVNCAGCRQYTAPGSFSCLYCNAYSTS